MFAGLNLKPVYKITFKKFLTVLKNMKFEKSCVFIFGNCFKIKKVSYKFFELKKLYICSINFQKIKKGRWYKNFASYK